MAYRVVCRDCDAGSTVQDSGAAEDLIAIHEYQTGHDVNWWELNGGADDD
jgi:hypothetical protein